MILCKVTINYSRGIEITDLLWLVGYCMTLTWTVVAIVVAIAITEPSATVSWNIATAPYHAEVEGMMS